MKNLYKALIGAVIVMALLLHPITRTIIWFILPFGSGWDDLAFAAVFIIWVILLITGGANGVIRQSIKNSFKWLKE